MDYDSYIKYINAVNDLKVENVNPRELYDDGMIHRYGYIPLVSSNNNHKIDVMMVNSARHTFSNYDEKLKIINSIKTKDDYRYHLLKNRVLNLIAEQYPFLKKECKRQKYRVNLVTNVSKEATNARD